MVCVWCVCVWCVSNDVCMSNGVCVWCVSNGVCVVCVSNGVCVCVCLMVCDPET